MNAVFKVISLYRPTENMPRMRLFQCAAITFANIPGCEIYIGNLVHYVVTKRKQN